MTIIRKPIDVTEAVQKVMDYKRIGEGEVVSFHECDGRYLHEDILATNDIPSFNKSPYDGYAVRSEDTINATKDNGVTFDVLETIGAGELSSKSLEPFQAIRIMTGAELPEGSDAIIMFEEVESFEKNGKEQIKIFRELQKDENVMHIGSEVTKGDVLIKKGTRITPGVKAVLATFGYADVKVSKKPIVGVVATGTELLDVDEPLERGKIRNSNGYMIISQANQAGADVVDYGKLADELEPSYKKMEKILGEVDLLITTGGVSVGDYDLIPEIYERLGAKTLFNKVAMRPGSVTTVAVKDDKFLFGLSGNPSACYVGFELFARPIIQTYLQNPRPYLKRASAILKEDFPKANPFYRFVRSNYTYQDGQLYVQLAGIDKSNVVTSLAHTTCFMVLPGGTAGYKKGDKVQVLLLEETDGDEKFILE